MCVRATYFEQHDPAGRRIVVHLFNDLDTAANHGLPKSAVPLREETVPIHGIRVRFSGGADLPRRFHIEPGGAEAEVVRTDGGVVVRCPALEIHSMVVAEH